MNIKDILSDNPQSTIPLFKSDNYSNIYKKTEKIVCAVFLVTDDIQHKGHNKDIVTEVRKSAKDALVSVIELLSSPASSEEGDVRREVVRHASTLRSLLSVLVATRVLRTDLADVLVREIDSVLYAIGALSSHEAPDQTAGTMEYVPDYVRDEKRRPRAPLVAGRRATPIRRESGGAAASADGVSRRDAILAIIRQRGVVSIKDISESITDCSEKTIQRELLELIKDNFISKEGERRWSKYRLVS